MYIAIEDCAELAVRCLGFYVHESEERLTHAARAERADCLEAGSVLKEAKKGKRS